MKLSQEQREEIRRLVIDYLFRSGLSSNKLAAKVGMSPATLSAIKSGDHEKVADQKFIALHAYLKGGDGWRIMGTANLEAIHAMCSDCQQHHLMRAVVAPSGAGKTTALRSYARNQRRSNAFYVLCRQTMRKSSFLSAILQELGSPYRGPIDLMIDRIAEIVMSLEDPLLILDDVGKLDKVKYMYILELYDATEGRLGMVLSGVNYTYDNLMSNVRRQVIGFPEISTRIGDWMELDQPNSRERSEIIKANGITDEDQVKALLAKKNLRSLREAIHTQKRINERDDSNQQSDER